MLALLLLPTSALAEPAPWSPLRVSLDCQSDARVDICTYVQGSLDALKVVAVVPLSDGQVVLHLNATRESTSDFIQLRAVSDAKSPVPRAPASFEQQVEIDYRLPVDEQRELLEPALYRTLAPFLSLAVPGAVSVTLTAPEGTTIATKTTPYGFAIWAGGYGNWSQQYPSLSMWSGVSVSRTTNESEQELWVNYDRSIELQPSLVVNSTDVALTSDSSALIGATTASWNLSKHWSVGGNVRGGHDDPEGQYLGTVRAQAGVEYNLFPSDDPRGNVLAIAWIAGGQADWYNQTNTLGQDRAFFPADAALASGSVRIDTVSLGIDLALKSQLWPFFERYVLYASIDTDITLGDHVDFSIQMEGRQQAIPGPAEIDTSSYEEVTRASYAEPLDISGFAKLKFHWDNTNSARNNRFSNTVQDIDVTEGL
ncbi:MAG: hypothetical protein EXR71_21090 [Myxococcales bacterium]|nr:hypothetical protein [Myxococcales bacterium]